MASSGIRSGITIAFQDEDIVDVGSVALDEITSDSATTVKVTLGDDAGDDFKVDSTSLVVKGDTGKVGIGTDSPQRTLHIKKEAAVASGGVKYALNQPLIVEDDNRPGVQFIGSANNIGIIEFGDPDHANAGSINFDHSTDRLRFGFGDDAEKVYIDSSGNMVIDGDLTVNGTTTTISTTNTVIEDKLVELSNGTTGTPSGDAGLIIERGDSDNAALVWDESRDEFVLGTTSATGASTGDLTVTRGNLSVAKMGAGTEQAEAEIHAKRDASSGGQYSTTAPIIVEDDSRPGIQFAGSANNIALIQFGDNAAAASGMLYYDHSTDKLRIDAGGNSDRLTVDASGNIAAAGTITTGGDITIPDGDSIKGSTGGDAITIDAAANISFSNNVTVTSTFNAPTTITLPNTGNSTITTTATAHNAAGKDLAITAGAPTAGTTNDIAGGDLTLKPGAGKGTGVGGDFIVQTAAAAGGSAHTINSHTTKFIIKESGSIGMGTTGPDRKLDILDASNPQLRLTHTDGSKYCDFQVDTNQHLTIDAQENIKLDSGSTNATVKILGGGSEKANITVTSDDVAFANASNDKDLLFKGVDNDVGITALTLDMSAAGHATFNNNIRVGGNVIEASDGGSTITMDTSDNVTVAGDLQVSGNDIKDSGGNTAITFDGSGNISNDVIISGSLAYVPKTIVDTGTGGTTLTAANSGATVVLTNDGGYVTLPDATAGIVGTTYVIVSGANVTDVAIKLASGSSDGFHSNGSADASTADETVAAYKAKTVVCTAANVWVVIG